MMSTGRCFFHSCKHILRDNHRLRRFSSPASTPVASTSPSLLQSTLKDWIKLNGPLSVAQFMRFALTHPQHGYYTRGNHGNTVIGGQGKGDFITSPEISQIFGEIIAVWFVTQLQQAKNQKRQFQLVELGPGRGTLMYDMLATWKRSFPDIYNQISSIHLVEQSQMMRDIQKQKLSSIIKGQLVWHEHYETIPKDKPHIIVAHEFFDAMPVHQFQMTKDGWREILVDLDETDEENLRFGLSSQETPPVKSFIHTNPNMSNSDDENIPVGNIREWSPESGHLIRELSHSISSSENPGILLVVDYGKNGPITQSFRAIQDHKFVHPLHDPGNCDLTADVDFEYLSQTAQQSCENLISSPVITQKDFLERLGAQVRMQMLLKNCKDSQTAKKLVESYHRLTGRQEMGQVYKIWSLKHADFGKCDNHYYPFF